MLLLQCRALHGRVERITSLDLRLDGLPVEREQGRRHHEGVVPAVLHQSDSGLFLQELEKLGQCDEEHSECADNLR